MQDPRIRDAIASIGRQLTPELLPRVQALFMEEQNAIKARIDRTHADIAYGPHARNRLDLYVPQGAKNAPVFVWVHGGGFLRGDKYEAGDPYNAHMGRFAALNGFIGVVITYRLAPSDVWPSGGEDVAVALDWTRAHIAEFGGDPSKIVLGGTSAGAAHCGHYLKLRAGQEQLAGAVLFSGLYGWTSLDERDKLYYGNVDDAARSTQQAVIDTSVPIFAAFSEFDPPRFQHETLGLLAARAEKGTRSFVAAGHNHFSLAMHIGTADTRLSDEVLDFIRRATA